MTENILLQICNVFPLEERRKPLQELKGVGAGFERHWGTSVTLRSFI